MKETLMGLGIAVLLMLTGLVPLLGVALKTLIGKWIEKLNRDALNGAVATLADKAAAPAAGIADKDIATQLQKLKDRVPDAVKELAVSDTTLRDKLIAATVSR